MRLPENRKYKSAQQENQSSFPNRKKKSSGNVQKTTICNSKLPRKFLAMLYGRSLPPLLVGPVLYRFFFFEKIKLSWK